jgi:opacity protein-like surface antigen
MKRLLLASVGISACAVTAVAGDMPLKAPISPAPSLVPSWTGVYVGGYLGGALDYSKLNDPFGPVSYGDTITTTAFIAGGQVGANYQIGNVVVGATADLSGITSRGDETCFGRTGGTLFASNCSVDPTLFGTLTGRLGYAFGRTLVYGKAGAAWQHNVVDMAVNDNPGHHFLASSNSYDRWGWTAGGGIEYALTPAWSLMLEYDYLNFGNTNVATPYVPGNPLPGHPVGPIAGISDEVHEAKLGINYRLGADPSPWSRLASATPVLSRMPLKARPALPPAALGWEIEGGARAMYSWSSAQWEFAEANAPNWFDSSKLTWSNMQSSSAELFGRVDSPWNVFLSGFVGVGDTLSGGQNDEDFNEPAPDTAYNNTFSTNRGSIDYAVTDIGYDALRQPNYKVGPFVGYTMFNELIFKSGCAQVASTTGNCSATPLPSSQLIGSEDMEWQAVRVGLSGQVALTDRLKLTADAAYLPYVTYSWLDDHLERDLQWQNWGHGIGVQTQAVLTYDVTNRLSVGIGGRYWAMWSTSGQRVTIDTSGTSAAEPTRNSIELAGAFLQTSYRFVPGGRDTAAKPGIFGPAPLLKAPTAPPASNWTGMYIGVEGGGVFGSSYQVGQLTTSGRPTAASTPTFSVDGGLVGGTVGYNSRFDGIFVFGVEGDMSWADASGSAHQIPPFNTKQVASTTELWLATARARLGVAPADRWLVYMTGGLAGADVEAEIVEGHTVDFPKQAYVRPGWTAGGGLEALIYGGWSAKLEYLYVALENHAYYVPTPNIPNETNRAGGIPLHEDIIRAGVDYKLSSM